MRAIEADVPRYDYAIFDQDTLVTNALLTPQEAAAMELDGLRCVRVRDTIGEGLPAFRGGFSRSGSVARKSRNGGRWDR